MYRLFSKNCCLLGEWPQDQAALAFQAFKQWRQAFIMMLDDALIDRKEA